MAATGYSPIQLYYSTTASTAPTAGNLASGELAINITDGKLYYKDNAGAVQTLATKAATSGTYTSITLSGGTANGVAYLNGSKVVTTGSALTFDGTNLSLIEANGSGAKSILMQGGATAGDYGIISIANGSTIRGRLVANASADEFRFDTAGGASTSYAWYIGSSYSETMRLTSTGLGIGTSSPVAKLQVDGTSGFVARFSSNTNAAVGIRLYRNDVDVGEIGSGDALFSGGSGSSFGFTTPSAIPLLFGTNSSERMRLDSSGNLLVGATSTINSERLGVTKNGNVFLVKNTQNTGTARLVYQNGAGTIDYFYNYASSSELGTITNTTTSVAYNTTSDYRLKDNQQPLTGSGAFIDALQPKTWNWKADGSRGVGFIAHEVQEVSPGSVVGEKDGEQMQAMEYGSAEFIANIIAELQSLRVRVAALES